MRILLTNDDGYKSIGFLILLNELLKKHDVDVCIPMYEKSGSSSSLTLFDEMKYKEIKNGYTVDATPTDCVKIGLNGFFKKNDFDFIISGINYGVNICNDIIYSGTAGAAKEGVINNVIGIACSTGDYSPNIIRLFSNFLMNFIDSFDYSEIQNYKNYFFNINYPFFKYKGFKFTIPGTKKYNDSIFTTDCGDYKLVKLLVGTDSFIAGPNTDISSINDGNISIGAFEYKNSTFYPITEIFNHDKFESKLKYNLINN